MSEVEESDTEENAWEDKRDGLEAFPEQIAERFPEGLKSAVAEAGYSYSETGSFFNFDGAIKDPDLMIQIWAIVETIRIDGGFPESLRM